MKKIKATEIVLFVCLLISCLFIPRFVTAHLLSGITHSVLIRPANQDYHGQKAFYMNEPVFPEGGWVEQVIRVELIGLTVFYAFRVAKRIDRQSLPGAGEDKEK